jgi:peroxiredoxin
VSIDKADKSVGLIKKIEADGKGKIAYRLLSDPDAKTIDAYGLRDERYADKSVFGIPRPAILVLDKKRKIVWAKIEDDYKKRPTNEEIRAELDKIKR